MAEHPEQWPPLRVACAALAASGGDEPETLYASLASGLSTAQVDPVALPVDNAIDSNGVRVLTVDALFGLTYEERMEYLVDTVANPLTESLKNVSLDAVVLLPPGPHRSGRTFNRSGRLQERLASAVPALTEATWWSVEEAESPASVLQRVVESLRKGEIRAALFGGIDACATQSAMLDRSIRTLMSSADGENAPQPADAAAFVLLSRDEGESAPGTALLREYVHGATGDIETWKEQLERVYETSEKRPWQTILNGFGSTSRERSVWAHVRRNCFFLRQSTETEHITAWQGIGLAGAATLPLLLNAALGRFGFGEPVARHVVAIAGGDHLAAACTTLLESPGHADTGEMEQPVMDKGAEA